MVAYGPDLHLSSQIAIGRPPHAREVSMTSRLLPRPVFTSVYTVHSPARSGVHVNVHRAAATSADTCEAQGISHTCLTNTFIANISLTHCSLIKHVPSNRTRVGHLLSSLLHLHLRVLFIVKFVVFTLESFIYCEVCGIYESFIYCEICCIHTWKLFIVKFVVFTLESFNSEWKLQLRHSCLCQSRRFHPVIFVGSSGPANERRVVKTSMHWTRLSLLVCLFICLIS